MGIFDTLKDYILLSAKERANKADEKGYRPLYHAINEADADGFADLIADGADVNFTLPEGKTFGEYLIENGSPDMVKQALDAGLKLNLKAGEKPDLALVAEKRKNTDILNLLLDKGVDFSQTKTCLEIAMEADDKALFDKMIAKGISPNTMSLRGEKGVVYSGFMNMVRTNYTGETLLEYALEKYPQYLTPLLEAGADINAEGRDNKTLLHRLAKEGKLKELQDCLKYQPDFNKQDKWGYRALDYALQGSTPQHQEMAQLLIAQGADINQTMDVKTGFFSRETRLSYEYTKALAVGDEKMKEITLLNGGAKINDILSIEDVFYIAREEEDIFFIQNFFKNKGHSLTEEEAKKFCSDADFYLQMLKKAGLNKKDLAADAKEVKTLLDTPLKCQKIKDLMISGKISPDTQGLLLGAVENSNIEMVDFLLSQEKKPDVRPVFDTALEQKNTALISRLLEGSTDDLNDEHSVWVKAMSFAIKNNNEEIFSKSLDFLKKADEDRPSRIDLFSLELRAEAKKTIKSDQLLSEAINYKRDDFALRLIEAKVGEYQSKELVQQALAINNEEITKAILQKTSFDVLRDIQEKSDNPLFLKIISERLEKGNVSDYSFLQDKEGVVPLIYEAMQKKDQPLADKLIDTFIEKDISNSAETKKVMSVLLSHRQTDTAIKVYEAYLKKEEKMVSPSLLGATMEKAIQNNDYKMVDYLIKKGTAHAKNTHMQSAPLGYAILCKNFDMAEKLLKHPQYKGENYHESVYADGRRDIDILFSAMNDKSLTPSERNRCKKMFNYLGKKEKFYGDNIPTDKELRERAENNALSTDTAIARRSAIKPDKEPSIVEVEDGAVEVAEDIVNGDVLGATKSLGVTVYRAVTLPVNTATEIVIGSPVLGDIKTDGDEEKEAKYIALRQQEIKEIGEMYYKEYKKEADKEKALIHKKVIDEYNQLKEWVREDMADDKKEQDAQKAQEAKNTPEAQKPQEVTPQETSSPEAQTEPATSKVNQILQTSGQNITVKSDETAKVALTKNER